MAHYRSTPIFDADSLPAALRGAHSTRAGVWGVVRLLEGAVRLHFSDGTPPATLTPARPGLVAPRQEHWVELLGPMRLCIDFHDAPPA